jgi:hypothetical protein
MINSGQSSTTVNLSSALPSSTYSVVIIPSSTSGFSSANGCVVTGDTFTVGGCHYFNVAIVDASSFTVELRNPATGGLQTTGGAVSFFYVAVPYA